MKISQAFFVLRHRKRGLVNVQFNFIAGKPVSVWIGLNADSKRLNSIDNRDGRLKACATHAAEAMRLTFDDPPRSNHERKRRALSKPEPPKIFDPDSPEDGKTGDAYEAGKA